MVNKNLISLLKSFTKEEFSEFEKFAASPYFARERNVTPLLKYLKKFYPEFPEEKLKLESAYNKIYPGKPYSEAAIRMQVSELTKLCKDFLSVSSFVKNKNTSKLFLIEQLQIRSISDVFNSEVKELDKTITSEKTVSIDNLSSLLKLNDYKIIKLEMEGNHTEAPELHYYHGDYLPVDLLIKLINNVQDIIASRNNYIMKSKKVFSEVLLENINFDNLIKFISPKEDKIYQIVLFYFYRYKFYKSNGEHTYFAEAKEVLFKYRKSFSYYDFYGMMVNLANCCWWQIKLGNVSYNRELFEIHSLWVETGHLNAPHYSYIDLHIFKNMFALALTLNEIKWAENFLEKFSGRLNLLHSQDAINYSYALLHFKKKEYDKALDRLKVTEYRDYIYKADCQLVTLKIYYETDSAENLFYLADSFLHFLDKHKEEYVLVGRSNLNFTKMLIRLQKIKLNYNSEKLRGLKADVSNYSLFTSKQWFLRQIEALEK